MGHNNIKVVRSEDGRRWADLNAAQLLSALDGAKPRQLGSVNRKADAWAQAQGYAGAVHWTIGDLVDAGLAVETLSYAIRSRRAERTGRRMVGRFRWVAEDGRLL